MTCGISVGRENSNYTRPFLVSCFRRLRKWGWPDGQCRIHAKNFFLHISPHMSRRRLYFYNIKYSLWLDIWVSYVQPKTILNLLNPRQTINIHQPGLPSQSRWGGSQGRSEGRCGWPEPSSGSALEQDWRATIVMTRMWRPCWTYSLSSSSLLFYQN